MSETITPRTGFFDIRLAGALIANRLETWLAANESPSALAEDCHERQDCRTTSSEDGLH
ncbi:MAG: hypothetical protein ACREI9_12220 [Nitrospiraceae bacterium]